MMKSLTKMLPCETDNMSFWETSNLCLDRFTWAAPAERKALGGMPGSTHIGDGARALRDLGS